jgi:membrane protein involved in colicin uptake
LANKNIRERRSIRAVVVVVILAVIVVAVVVVVACSDCCVVVIGSGGGGGGGGSCGVHRMHCSKRSLAVEKAMRLYVFVRV